tara:strand:- start:4430 stop:4714 length:285 start_codon:yes stop_codon:yes gene_type:complete
MSNEENSVGLSERLASIEKKVDLIYDLILEGNIEGESASKELTSKLTEVFSNMSTGSGQVASAEIKAGDLPNVGDLNDLLESLKDFSSKIKDVY